MSIITRNLVKYRVEVLLAMSLILLGVAAAYGTMQLNRVIVLAQRTDTTTAICATLRNRKYDMLADMIDPAPVAPTATQAFDRKAFLAQIRSIEQHQGAVNSCTWHALQLDDNSATYIYSLRRAQTPVPISMKVILRREPDGSWRISRRSPFTSTPV